MGCCCSKSEGALVDESQPLLVNEVGPSAGRRPDITVQVPTIRNTEPAVRAAPEPAKPVQRELAPHEITKVRFEVTAYTKHGESLHILGDCAALGSYDPQHAVELYTSPAEYPLWHTEDGECTAQHVPRLDTDLPSLADCRGAHQVANGRRGQLCVYSLCRREIQKLGDDKSRAQSHS